MSAAAANIRRWRERPDIMVRELFDATPDLWQDGVLQAFPASPRMAMKACKGPGKTTLLSWLAWNFLLCYAHPKMAAVSITADNLADGLWTEMAKWRNKSALLQAAFTWTKTRIYANDHPETWFMSFRTFPKSGDANQQADTLAGLHADNLMFVIDEAGGIPDAVMAAAEAGLANAGLDGKVAHIVMAGNPTHLEGPLYRACTSERDLWHLTEITSDPDDPKRTPRVSIQWAKDQIAKYGRDNPWVLVNVFGKFPPSSINALLGPDDVAAARRRQPTDNGWRALARILGVDVARFGNDSSVIARRQGRVLFPMQQARNLDSLQGAGWVTRFYGDFEQDQRGLRADMAFVDDTGGWGAGWIDQLRSLNYVVRGVPFAGKADDPRFYNKRSEIHWRLAEWVKTVGCLPDDDELAAELTAHTYCYRGDRLWVLEKELVKEALGRSPDKADAVAITFAYDVAAPAGRAADGTDSRGSNLLAAVQESYGDPGKAGQPYNPLG